MGLGSFAREHMLYIGSAWQSGAVMPPRWKFFEDLSKSIPQGTDAIAEFGPGSGRLIEVVVAQRKLLSENGVYIAVDCNAEFLDFIRRERPRVAEDKRVHLVRQWAQQCRDELGTALDGRKLQAIVLSIPFSYLSPEDLEKLWGIITTFSAKDVRIILYNVYSTRAMLQEHCTHVFTKKVRDAHYGLPPWFEMNFGSGLLLPEEKKVRASDEKPHLNGKAPLTVKAPLPPVTLQDRRMWQAP